MLERFFRDGAALWCLRDNPLACHLDSFSTVVAQRGYARRKERGLSPWTVSRNWFVPKYLTSMDVERVLTVGDRTAPVGRRDYALLLLLARLGLRC